MTIHREAFLPSPLTYRLSHTECITDLDLGSEMIIFESILTTFKASVVFRGSWGSSVNWLEPKTKPP